ncbi:conserved membrane hypothetical protein [Methylocella tundrae]|uniref:Uncharacterized protein n=1 Tax=Methylocella tundrae TaxID=227605 RepID=A0A8B6M7Z8_METTU|nr:conserved membrane hypothetical protein [Methylocella tundrae]
MCAILPLAIIRDVFEGGAARRRLSHVAALLGVTPLIAPTIGSWLLAVGSWRTIYAAQAAVGFAMALCAWIGFHDTLPPDRRPPIKRRSMLHGYADVLSSVSFRTFALIYALSFACAFSFISGAPSVLIQTLGLSHIEFALFFAAAAVWFLVGSLISARLSGEKCGPQTLMQTGLAIMIFGSGIGLAAAAAGKIHVFTLLPAAALAVFGFGLVGAMATHDALQDLPQAAGAAAGALRCGQMTAGAAVSALLSGSWTTGPPLP